MGGRVAEIGSGSVRLRTLIFLTAARTQRDAAGLHWARRRASRPQKHRRRAPALATPEKQLAPATGVARAKA
jgi:hypothetical protein